MDSAQKGALAVLKVQIRAIEKGAECFMPLDASSRFDMVVYWCGKFYRAQVKYAGGTPTKSAGCANVHLRKGDRGERTYTDEEIDVMLVYVPCVDKVCWFGPEIFHRKTAIQIRYLPAKNGQTLGCVLLDNYVW
jgi:hypothetical protein